MSLSRNNQSPPEAMTWRRASPILILCGVFDLSRAFFSMFWLLGPALAAAYCVNSLVGTDTTGVLGKAAAVACTLVATKTGVLLSPVLIMFGTIMAMTLGLVGWMTIYILLILLNPSIFKVGGGSVLTMLIGLCVSQIPFIGALPTLTLSTGRLYRAQIKHEKVQLKEWTQKNTAQIQQRRQQQLDQLMLQQQERAMQDAQFEEQQAEEIESEEEDARLSEEEELEAEQGANNGTEGTRGRSRGDGRGARASHGSTRERGGGGGGGLNGEGAGAEGGVVTDDNQFETMSDALSQLNSKQNRTPEENEKLTKAKKIMETHSIDATERDPVLRAAYERAEMGQKVFDGTSETRNGFVFSNSKNAGMAHGGSEWR